LHRAAKAGNTPLHLAAINSDQFLDDALIAHGASARETTPQGDQVSRQHASVVLAKTGFNSRTDL
jgi:ankyrin repeat protein